MHGSLLLTYSLNYFKDNKMAECSNISRERDIVKCGICLSTFTKPILLDCFHIFCTPCVTKLAEGKETLICPLCRAVHVLPDKGVDGLTLYPFTQDAILPDTNVMVLCQMCDNDKAAVSNCIDCNSKMCFECSAYHLKHKIFKTHKTEKIEIECTEIESTETKMPEDDTCKLHKEELTLFCESCNRAICNSCMKQNHRFHKLEPITFPAKKRRDFLQSAISALKSKITAINQKKEITKLEENIYYKLCRQGKEEIRKHSEKSKDTVCQIIDILTDLNVQKIDKMQKQDIKSITNYQDELETMTLSLQCLLRSSEDICNLSCDGKMFNDYAFLYQTLLSSIRQDNEFVLFAPQFWSGHPIEHKYIEKCFGMVDRGKRPSIASESKTHIYTLPFICEVTNFTRENSFSITGTFACTGLFGICENKALFLIHVAQREKIDVCLYSKDSGLISGYHVEMTDSQDILGATQKELWVKFGPLISVKKIDEGTCTRTEEIVRLPELEGVKCSLLNENRIVAYSVTNKCFYEVKTDGDWPITINETTIKTITAEEKLVNLVTTEPFSIIETLSKHIMLTSKDKVITLDRKFIFCNIYESVGSDFKGMCEDPYGNIFIVDSALHKICLFNSSGDFIHYVSVKEIHYPRHITRDSVGNIWFTDNNGSRVMVYSYL